MLAVCIYQAATGDTITGSFMVQYCCIPYPVDHRVVCQFCRSIAEARGKAQAESLRKTREDTPAKKVFAAGEMFVNEVKIVPSSQLEMGDLFVCEAGDIIPMDGEIS